MRARPLDGPRMAKTARRQRRIGVSGWNQYPTGQELAKLLLNEAGQAPTVAAVRDLTEEEIEVLPNDGVKHGVLSVAGAIRGGGRATTIGTACTVPRQCPR